MLAELQVLNKVINDSDISFIINNSLSEDYFTDLKQEFKFILNHYKLYNTVPDLTTFIKTFPNFETLEVKESENYLLNELYRERNETFLVNTFNKIKDLLVSGKTDQAVDFYKKSYDELSSGNKHLSAVNILEDISRYDSYLDKCSNFDRYYLTTGFKELDDSLGGGIDRLNSYFVISARPGIGKTLVMMKFAAAAASKGLRVGLYEGEMAVDKIAGRYDTLTSHISNGAITHGNTSVANNYKIYLDELAKSHNGEFFVMTRDMVPDDKVTVDVLESFIDKYQLDVLFVDQISLLDSTSRLAKDNEKAAELSKGLKNLQVRKKIPLIVASQQNRASLEQNVVGVENLSASDRIGQDATEIIFLSKKESLMTIDIAKARDGAKVYKLTYEVDFDKGEFNYIADDSSESSNADMYVNSGEDVF